MTAFIVLVAVVVFAAAICIRLLAQRNAARSNELPATVQHTQYELQSSLLTPAERSFFGVLSTLNLDYTIVAKVRLADVVTPKRGLPPRDRQRAFNRVSAKHVDFLLLRRSDAKPVLGIELDDASHERIDRADRDTFVDAVFSHVGLPILHVPVRSAYELRDVRERVERALR